MIFSHIVYLLKGNQMWNERCQIGHVWILLVLSFCLKHVGQCEYPIIKVSHFLEKLKKVTQGFLLKISGSQKFI